MPLEAGNVGYLTSWSASDMCCCSADALSVSRVHPAAVIAARTFATSRVTVAAATAAARQHDHERDGERDDADEAGADEDVRAGHREAAALRRLLLDL